MYKLFGHDQILETQCSYIIIKTYENTISIIQLHNLAKLSKKMIKYTIQFFQAESPLLKLFYFSSWVFFHEHSRFTRQQGKREAISLTPLYHFYPLHRNLEISRAIAAESSPLHIASSRIRTGNLCFPSASR